MLNPRRKNPIRAPDKYTILDNGERHTIDKEYIELGKREGWLELFRIIHTKDETEYVYIYPFSFPE